MIATKEEIKAEIDSIPDEYVPILYQVVKAFEIPPRRLKDGKARLEAWHHFIEETYGCLANDPIERGVH